MHEKQGFLFPRTAGIPLFAKEMPSVLRRTGSVRLAQPKAAPARSEPISGLRDRHKVANASCTTRTIKSKSSSVVANGGESVKMLLYPGMVSPLRPMISPRFLHSAIT